MRLSIALDNKQKVIVRFALILGVNDDEKDVLELGAFASSFKNAKELSILPYHKAGFKSLRY